MMGGLYGLARSRTATPDAAGGAAFGTALWLFGDEFAVPLLGLAQGPTAFPVRQHLHRLGAHLAYGLATAAATQALNTVVAPPKPARWALGAAKTYLKLRVAKAAGKAALRAFRRLRS